MSADLLAEFDSFYQAPEKDSHTESAASNTQSRNDSFDVSWFDSPQKALPSTTSPTARTNPPTTDPDDDWGDFTSFDNTVKQHSSKPSIEAWPSFGQVKDTDVSAILGQPSPKKSRPRVSISERHRAGSTSLKPAPIRVSSEQFFSGNIAELVKSAEGRVSPTRTRPAVRNGHSRNNSSLSISNLRLRKLRASPERKSEVLFDADEPITSEKEDEDEFGDFETVQATTTQVDLLSLDVPVAESTSIQQSHPPPARSPGLLGDSYPYPQAPKSPSFQERNPFSDLALSTAPVDTSAGQGSGLEDLMSEETPATAWPTYDEAPPKHTPYHDSPAKQAPDEDDDWGDFNDMPPEEDSKGITPRPDADIDADAWAWDAADGMDDSVPSTGLGLGILTSTFTTAPPAILPVATTIATTPAPPTSVSNYSSTSTAAAPTNIPPPSLLLTLFPALLTLPQSLTTTTPRPPDPSTLTFLQGYLLIATTAARIIAGRKLRWKRDSYLSQGMKMGPARAAGAGAGGMKLAGVDRAESGREEREVGEVVRVWRAQVGRLRALVASANARLPPGEKHLFVPEMGESMVVRVEEGLGLGLVVKSGKPCALCGLRREERVRGVDPLRDGDGGEGGVEDSFGEWWVEFWGHRGCRNFWEGEGVRLLRGR